ncbi:MAG: hypothetical protein AAGJ54_11165 [Planctomycetota bacterium]
MNHRTALAAVASTFLIAAGSSFPLQPESDYGSDKPADAASSFDEAVRGDFFRGLLEDDPEAWTSARETIMQALATNPDDGEALAWHGSMLIADAGEAFNSGDFQRGMELWEDGLDRMDRGVKLDNTVNSMIPRGVTLLQVYRHEPNPARARKMLDTAVADLNNSLEFLTPYWETQSKHARGMLLLMLADAINQRAERDMSAALALRQRIAGELPGTSYAARARNAMEKMQTPADDAALAGAPTTEFMITQWLVEIVRLADISEQVPADAIAAVASAGGPDDKAWVDVSSMLGDHTGPAAGSIQAFAGIMRSFDLFSTGDFQNAMPLWNESQASLEGLASKHPRNRSVAACRAAAYLLAHPYQRDPREQTLMAAAATSDTDQIAGWLTRSAADADTRARTDVIRAMAAEATGDTELAVKHLRAAITADSTSDAAKYAAQMMQRLDG